MNTPQTRLRLTCSCRDSAKVMDVAVKPSKKRPAKSKHTKFPVVRSFCHRYELNTNPFRLVLKKLCRRMMMWARFHRQPPLLYVSCFCTKSSIGWILTGPLAKALELFLSNVVEEASKVTTSRNAKRVEPHHL